MTIGQQGHKEKFLEHQDFVPQRDKALRPAKHPMTSHVKDWHERFPEGVIFFSTQMSQHQMQDQLTVQQAQRP